MIRREDREGVTVLGMEHGKANALDVELSRGLTASLTELEAESRCGAAVITGTGGIFSAGVDLFRLLEGGEAYADAFLPVLVGLIERLQLFSKPLVAAINGHAIAGGGVIAFACDYRVMATGDGTLGVPELRVGVPFPSGALDIVRAAVPRAHLRDVVLRGSLSSPEEALARGLVHEVVRGERLIDRAVEVGRGMGEIPSATFALTKRRLLAPRGETEADRADDAAPAHDADATYDPNAAHDADAAYDQEVEALWRDPKIHAHVRAYLERTIGKSSR